MDLVRNPNIRKKFFILAFDWVANAVVYNGLSYNATNLGVSDYLAFFIGNEKTSEYVRDEVERTCSIRCFQAASWKYPRT